MANGTTILVIERKGFYFSVNSSKRKKISKNVFIRFICEYDPMNPIHEMTTQVPRTTTAELSTTTTEELITTTEKHITITEQPTTTTEEPITTTHSGTNQGLEFFFSFFKMIVAFFYQLLISLRIVK